jgi:cytochrome-b5 reductase
MMRVGDVLEIRGPISGFVCNAETMPKHMSLIAGGTGIAPCLQIIRQIIADKSDTKVTLLYGANDPSELVFRDELDSYENVKTIYTVDYVPNGVEWNGRVGYINKEMIQSHLPSPDDTFVVMCGTWMMMKTLRVTLEELGYADKMFVYG